MGRVDPGEVADGAVDVGEPADGLVVEELHAGSGKADEAVDKPRIGVVDAADIAGSPPARFPQFVSFEEVAGVKKVAAPGEAFVVVDGGVGPALWWARGAALDEGGRRQRQMRHTPRWR